MMREALTKHLRPKWQPSVGAGSIGPQLGLVRWCLCTRLDLATENQRKAGWALAQLKGTYTSEGWSKSTAEGSSCTFCVTKLVRLYTETKERKYQLPLVTLVDNSGHKIWAWF